MILVTPPLKPGESAYAVALVRNGCYVNGLGVAKGQHVAISREDLRDGMRLGWLAPIRKLP